MGSLRKTFGLMLFLILLVSLTTFPHGIVKAQPIGEAPTIAFQKEYGDSRTEAVSNLIQTNDGGYAFVDLGWSHNVSFQPSTFYKIDSSGNLQ